MRFNDERWYIHVRRLAPGSRGKYRAGGSLRAIERFGHYLPAVERPLTIVCYSGFKIRNCSPKVMHPLLRQPPVPHPPSTPGPHRRRSWFGCRSPRSWATTCQGRSTFARRSARWPGLPHFPAEGAARHLSHADRGRRRMSISSTTSRSSIAGAASCCRRRCRWGSG